MLALRACMQMKLMAMTATRNAPAARAYSQYTLALTCPVSLASSQPSCAALGAAASAGSTAAGDLSSTEAASPAPGSGAGTPSCSPAVAGTNGSADVAVLARSARRFLRRPPARITSGSSVTYR